MVNTITFGGVLSSTYDIYISGEGVWSAPERDAEVITIPGRNGAFVQDNGRFQNITVTYPAFIVKDTNTNFKTKIDSFRNAIASKVGYQRLVDTFHADEYRMAAFIGGLEVEPILYNDHAATFDLVFECKPQRFLTSGETAVSVANNGTITNPTLFDAKPQLQVKGYGTIGIGSEEIEVENVEIGRIVIGDNYSTYPMYSQSLLNVDNLNAGDTIEASPVLFTITAKPDSGLIITNIEGNNGSNCSVSVSYAGNGRAYVTIKTYNATFAKGTPSTFTAYLVYRIYFSDNTYYDSQLNVSLAYNGDNRITFSASDNESSSKYEMGTSKPDLEVGTIYGESTKSALGNPMYIDLDIGEAWNEDSGTPVSVNNAVTMPAKLPVLPPGLTTITYDNTITSFKIVPRWWQV